MRNTLARAENVVRFAVVPSIGIGQVRLGMNRDEARQAMGSQPHEFFKTPNDVYPTDAFDELGIGFHVYYLGAQPQVAFIELSRDEGVEAIMHGFDLFAMPAGELVAALAIDHSLVEPDAGHTFVFPDLGLSLWRSTLPESDEDPEGRFFDAAAIGTPQSLGVEAPG